jgi:uncharacterized membrane protein
MTPTDWLLLVALSVLWGGSFYFTKIAVLEISPLTLALIRALVAGLTIAVLLRPLGGAMPRDLATWKMFAVIAALNNAIPFSLIVWGQQYIPIGLASILNATSPLFTVVVAHFATQDDKLTPNRAIGLIAGFIGVVVLLGPDLLTELGQHVWAQLALLVAAFFFALGAIYARRLRGHDRRAALDAYAGFARRDLGQPVARRVLDRVRVSDLLPHPEPRRRHQRAAGDVPHSGQRDPARIGAARRAARSAAIRWHACDRGRARRDRRPADALAHPKVPPHRFVKILSAAR